MRESLESLKRELKLLAIDLPNGEYIDFMREIASWAEGEAERIEFEMELREWEQ